KARPLAKRSGRRNGFGPVPLRDIGKHAVYHGDRLLYPAIMALALLALATLASASPSSSTPARASALATVRILPGARVHLSPSSKAHMVKASVRVEDGRRRPAYLIEFE
ncbi:MAG TPA: hypothetical protein VGR05_05425, partial [Sphingomicrobium sp.]|nr:hypothetical protein [Sphingomicrobium sp.]